MDHILCKRRLLRHYLEWVWVILGGWDIILGGWGWVGVYEALFCVGEVGWGIIVSGWGWMGKYFGWLRVSESGWGWVGVGALFEKAHNKKRISYFRRTRAIRTMTTKQQQKTQTMGYTKYQQLQRMSHPNMMISRAKLLLNNPKHRRTLITKLKNNK